MKAIESVNITLPRRIIVCQKEPFLQLITAHRGAVSLCIGLLGGGVSPNTVPICVNILQLAGRLSGTLASTPKVEDIPHVNCPDYTCTRGAIDLNVSSAKAVLVCYWSFAPHIYLFVLNTV